MSTSATSKGLSNQFWDKWYHADELNRLELVQQLTGIDGLVMATLTNSYLTDLVEYLEEEFKVQKGNEEDDG